MPLVWTDWMARNCGLCLSCILSNAQLNLDEILSTRDALDSLNATDRDIVMVIVGTGRAAGLERMLRFLSERHGVPVMARLFNVFETSGGDMDDARDFADRLGRLLAKSDVSDG